MNKIDHSSPGSELLRTFCSVAETGNVTHAASHLARTQSAISVQIKKLEEQLSVTLFERQARGVVLTEQGRRLLPMAKNALAEVDRIGSLFATPLTGRVRVGIPDDYNETILEVALARFAKRHRNVEVFVQSGCTASFPDAIANDQLDIAVYSAEPMSSDEAFFTEPTVWVASSDFEIDRDCDIPMAIFDRHCWWREVATAALDKARIPWRTVYLSASFASIKASIRSGLAVGVLAQSAVEPSMKILGDKEGFPALPHSSLKLLTNENTSTELITEMENAIREAVSF
ncbi:MAG: LysR family transcriptional regulator [Granulosicoccus sp.]|nr:LysR family transcriptional regulator [Granulosicoccus sp.]